MMRTLAVFNSRMSRFACMVIAALLSMFLTLAAPIPAQAAPGIPPAETNALESFFKIMGGPVWYHKTHWFVGDPCLNSWYGITCDPGNTHVIGITMNNNNLMGDIDRVDLAPLTHLETLDLFINHITGDIGGFKVVHNPRLITLQLAGNLIKGDIENLDLRSNPDLVTLALGVNYITGRIDLMDLSGNGRLENLGLQINYIGGDIGGLDLSFNLHLEKLLLQFNQIKGDPKALDFSLHPALRQFTIAGNLIDGTVPDLTMTSITFPSGGGWLWMCSGSNIVRPTGDAGIDGFADKFDPSWSATGGCGP
jgi:hypothetical protein